jgi:hypothetical protein
MIARAFPAMRVLLGASMFALIALTNARTSAAPIPPASLPDDSAVPVPRETMTADASGGYARILVSFGAPTAVSASIADGVLTIKLAKPIDADMVDLVGKLASYVTSGRRDPDHLTYRFGLGVPVTLHTSTSEGRTAIDLVPVSFAGTPPPAQTPGTQVATAPPAALAPALREMPQSAAAPTANLQGDGAVLRFPQARGHAVAVFVRGDTTWIVLDNHPTIEAAALFANIAPLVAKADSSETGTAAVLRLRFKSPLVATVAEDATAMTVSFAPAGEQPRAIGFSRSRGSGLATLSAQLLGAAHLLKLADPDAGDRLLVVPARPGRGVPAPRRFVELEALQSVSGIAVIPYADDLTAVLKGDSVELSRPQGLSLSTPAVPAPDQ